MRGKVLSSFTLHSLFFLSVYLRLALPDRAAAAIRVRRGRGGKESEGGGNREERGEMKGET